VCFKVMPKLARAHDDHVTNLLHLGVEPFGCCENLRNKINCNCFFIILPFCIISFSVTHALLIAECVAETYKMRGCYWQSLSQTE
jgi:hypothetical protein